MWTMSLTPLPPCGLTWTIERPPPSPYLSTWFMNATYALLFENLLVAQLDFQLSHHVDMHDLTVF